MPRDPRRPARGPLPARPARRVAGRGRRPPRRTPSLRRRRAAGRPGAHDGLLVLGGSMGADDDAEHAWLGPDQGPDPRARCASGVPTLGRLPRAPADRLGRRRRVVRNPAGRQLGLLPLGWTAAARATTRWSGRSPAAGADRSLHWNQDVVAQLPVAAHACWPPRRAGSARRPGSGRWRGASSRTPRPTPPSRPAGPRGSTRASPIERPDPGRGRRRCGPRRAGRHLAPARAVRSRP